MQKIEPPDVKLRGDNYIHVYMSLMHLIAISSEISILIECKSECQF